MKGNVSRFFSNLFKSFGKTKKRKSRHSRRKNKKSMTLKKMRGG